VQLFYKDASAAAHRIKTTRFCAGVRQDITVTYNPSAEVGGDNAQHSVGEYGSCRST
jgi:hypothetical protein